VAGGWKNSRNEFGELYCLGYIVRVMKSGIMKWPGHVECTGEMRRAHEVFGRKTGRGERVRPTHRW